MNSIIYNKIETAFEIIKYYLTIDTNIYNNNDIDGKSLLHIACAGGGGGFGDGKHPSSEIVELIIKNGININLRDKFYRNPLHYACKVKNTIAIIKILIKNGVNTEDRDYNLRTPLHIACIENSIEYVNLLLQNGADTMAMDIFFHTPFQLACINNCIEIVELFLMNNINNSKFIYEIQKGYELSCEYGRECVAELLLLNYDNINIHKIYNNKINQTALHLCAKSNSIKIIKCLLNMNVNINAIDNDGNTALHIACKHHNTEATQLLLASDGIDYTICNGLEQTAFHLACANNYNNINIVKIFLTQCTINVNQKDRMGNTSLLTACSTNSSIDIIRLLLDNHNVIIGILYIYNI